MFSDILFYGNKHQFAFWSDEQTSKFSCFFLTNNKWLILYFPFKLLFLLILLLLFLNCISLISYSNTNSPSKTRHCTSISNKVITLPLSSVWILSPPKGLTWSLKLPDDVGRGCWGAAELSLAGLRALAKGLLGLSKTSAPRGPSGLRNS